MTTQREHVYQTLLNQTDHPTADDVYLRVKADMPEIAMATVYNTLDALVKCGLIKQVNVERSATRYCSNLKDHCHFFCEECGNMHDVDYKNGKGDLPVKIPRGLVPTQVDISIRGHCSNPLECPNRSRR
jgi:Fur family peroxide stress response transcriptional regulator